MGSSRFEFISKFLFDAHDGSFKHFTLPETSILALVDEQQKPDLRDPRTSSLNQLLLGCLDFIEFDALVE